MIPICRTMSSIILRRTSSGMYSFSNVRALKTSNKKDDTSATAVEPSTLQEDQSVQRRKRYFFDYGFHGKNEEDERNNMHATAFMYITLMFMLSSFFFAYRPEMSWRDWAQREGYYELRRREVLGLPLIDPNYVDPSTVELPSDEELGDMDIVI